MIFLRVLLLSKLMYYNPYDPFAGCAAGWCGCLTFFIVVIFFGLVIGAFLGA